MEPKERFPPVPFPRKANRGLSFYASTPNVSTFSQIVVLGIEKEKAESVLDKTAPPEQGGAAIKLTGESVQIPFPSGDVEALFQLVQLIVGNGVL